MKIDRELTTTKTFADVKEGECFTDSGGTVLLRLADPRMDGECIDLESGYTYTLTDEEEVTDIEAYQLVRVK